MSNSKFFWLPGLLGIALAAGVTRIGLPPGFGFVKNLVSRPGYSGVLAVVVLAVTLWVLVALIFRTLASRSSMKIGRTATKALAEVQAIEPGTDIDGQLSNAISGYSSSMLRSRVRLLQRALDDGANASHVTAIVAGQSGVDTGVMQSSAGPLRALIWCLPTLGFMGTAFEMARAVVGMSEALSQTQGYNDLRNLLVGSVVPHLGSAFDITLFALGCSALCFVLLSLLQHHEETVLADADNLGLSLLAKAGGSLMSTTGPGTPSMSHELQALTSELRGMNQKLGEWEQTTGYRNLMSLANMAANGITHVASQLEQIRAIESQDMIIVRRPLAGRPGGRGGGEAS